MNEMDTPNVNAPLRALSLNDQPLKVLPLDDASVGGQHLHLNYADAALRRRMSRLSAASCIAAVCGIPLTIGVNLSLNQLAHQ